MTVQYSEVDEFLARLEDIFVARSINAAFATEVDESQSLEISEPRPTRPRQPSNSRSFDQKGNVLRPEAFFNRRRKPRQETPRVLILPPSTG